MLDARARRPARAYTLFESDKEFSEMLVLSRKVGERIHVGDNIVLEIRRIAGNRVTLALDAPRDVRILRGELERVAKEFKSPVQPLANGSVAPAPLPLLNNLAPEATSPDCRI
ncbi:MAG TPA: carbon storage regulator [Lacipirellulaceae bacterium]|nr:carbon storage regulator [Lacipirellulaceae bacterium]